MKYFTSYVLYYTTNWYGSYPLRFISYTVARWDLFDILIYSLVTRALRVTVIAKSSFTGPMVITSTVVERRLRQRTWRVYVGRWIHKLERGASISAFSVMSGLGGRVVIVIGMLLLMWGFLIPEHAFISIFIRSFIVFLFLVVRCTFQL